MPRQLSAVLLIWAAAMCFGQIRQDEVPEWQVKAGGKLSFEVASVKPSLDQPFRPPSFPLSDDDSFNDRGGHFFVILTDRHGAQWTAEWNSAKVLRRQGVEASTLKVGDHVVVTGHPAEHGPKLYLMNITRPSDGWEWRRRR